MARIRKNAECMTEPEWQIFNNALNKLIRDGDYFTHVFNHSERGPDGRAVHRMHGSMIGVLGFKRFLPWHRAYLLNFENALRAVNTASAEVTLPYWNWVTSPGIPTGLNHTTLRGVSRNTGRPDFTSANEINGFLKILNFDDFVSSLETGPHNRGHNWVGGIMLNPYESPTDPMFWLHHANVDRIWDQWQKIPGNENKKHSHVGDPADTLLDPWAKVYNIDNTNDITNLGASSYEYGPVRCARFSQER